MLTKDDLIKDRDALVTQINQIQGALSYVNQRIAFCEKAEADEKAKEDGKAKVEQEAQ